MRCFLLSSAIVLLTMAGNPHAQNLPFDMSPERPAQGMPDAFPEQPLPAQENADPTQPVINQPTQTEDFRRFVLPENELVLSGEIDERAWSIYLTPEQAASATTFNIGYQNS